MAALPAKFEGEPLALFFVLSQGNSGADPTVEEARAWSEEHKFGPEIVTLLDPGQTWFDSMFEAGAGEFMGAAVLTRGSVLTKKRPPEIIEPEVDIAEALKE